MRLEGRVAKTASGANPRSPRTERSASDVAATAIVLRYSLRRIPSTSNRKTRSTAPRRRSSGTNGPMKVLASTAHVPGKPWIGELVIRFTRKNGKTPRKIVNATRKLIAADSCQGRSWTSAGMPRGGPKSIRCIIQM